MYGRGHFLVMHLGIVEGFLVGVIAPRHCHDPRRNGTELFRIVILQDDSSSQPHGHVRLI
jgi:hypothetical protein